MTDTTQQQSVSSAHFIGIGGAGMSGIALVLHERGCRVSGSDLKASSYVRGLEDAGIKIRIGHESSTIDTFSPDVVVTSSAIPDTNPEVIRAHELGIPVWPRAKMLSWLSQGALTVAVAGTHGKTTTSSMVATMLDHLGWDPSFLIGGVVEEYKTNGRNGDGGYFVCEADESDGSFLFLNPRVVVVTNIEADHLDHYGTLENIEKTFCTFMGLVGDEGTIIIYGDNPHFVELAQSTGRRVVTYGFKEGNDYVCMPDPASDHTLKSSLTVRVPSGELVSVTIPANPGRHNMANASMFGSLKYMNSQELYDRHPYFWIMTPEGNYRYKIFSMFYTSVDSDVYLLYEYNGPAFKRWEEEWQAASEVKNTVPLTTKDKTVCMTTCTSDASKRFVVFGKCVSSEKPVRAKGPDGLTLKSRVQQLRAEAEAKDEAEEVM